MKLKAFVIYDSKVEAYNSPFFQRSTGEAMRSFEAACSDAGSNISKWPADYTLFEIGEYDDQSGVFEMYEAKRNLGTALEFKKASEPLPMFSGGKVASAPSGQAVQ